MIGILVEFVLTASIFYVLFLKNNTVNCYNYRFKTSPKHIVLIGDSYGVNYVGESGDGWVGYVDQFNILFPEVTTYGSAVGGSGFIGGVKETFEMQLDEVSKKKGWFYNNRCCCCGWL